MIDPWPAVAMLTTGALVYCFYWCLDLRKLNAALFEQLSRQADLYERAIEITEELTKEDKEN